MAEKHRDVYPLTLMIVIMVGMLIKHICGYCYDRIARLLLLVTVYDNFEIKYVHSSKTYDAAPHSQPEAYNV